MDITSLIAPSHQYDKSIFNHISIKKEYAIQTSISEKTLDYMMSVYNRNDNSNPFNFVYSLFDSQQIGFAKNQSTILGLANEMFAGSRLLNNFETEALMETFSRLSIKKPTLLGRK
ncbi:MAG: hypothetical protein SGJ10_10910 [Bacteroidota bacterium]|nr:hypothetical protein [Bacteroidota bacterium]